ncbi:MAG: hypothetical protein IIW48_07360, partial [Clostridia bacterium]|nr:hypothetical protein [Clostridia bacterium]
MKRLMMIVPVIMLVFVLSSCSSDLVAIEDCEWKMQAVMSATNDDIGDYEFVIAVGGVDEVHPEAKIIEMTLKAKDGILIIEDITNGKTYNGTYKVMQKTPKGYDYEITVDGISGCATVAPTKYYSGSEVPTLPINLGEYALYFTP